VAHGAEVAGPATRKFVLPLLLPTKAADADPQFANGTTEFLV
jgi:hypothetical protein